MSTRRILLWTGATIGACVIGGLLARHGCGGLVLFTPTVFVAPTLVRSWVQERRLERMYRRG